MTSPASARVLSDENRARVQRLARIVDKLPAAERPLWKKRVGARLQTVVGADYETGEQASASGVQFEWDLALANWLDGSYQVVSDRVQEVAQKGANAVSAAGFSLWPLAAVAVVFLLMKK